MIKENKVALSIIIILIVIIAGVLGLYSYSAKTKPELLTTSINAKNKTFVITGKRLTGVDVWIVPPGTNVTSNEYKKLTSTNLQSGSTPENQIWTAHIPLLPFQATTVFVKAYGNKENVIDTKTFPYNGATEVNNAFKQFWDPVLSVPNASPTR